MADAERSMTKVFIVGSAMFGAGMALIVAALGAAGSFDDLMSMVVAGGLTNQMMWCIVVGSILTSGGIGVVALTSRFRG